MSDETCDSLPRSDPAAAGLIENIARFACLLRENHVPVSLPAVLDAITALPLIDISDLDAFHCLLRANLISRKEDIVKFDALFYAYWLPQKRNRSAIPAEDGRQSQDEPEVVCTLFGEMADFSRPKDSGAEGIVQWRQRYSPDSLGRTDDLLKLRFAESRALYDSISKLLQPLTHRVSRRFKYTIRGKEINLRKILRKNMQFGGELILLEYKTRKLKKRRVIFLCDISGSMDLYTLMMLQFIHALKRIDRRTEVYFFSTDLSSGNHLFDRSDFAAAIAGLPEAVAGWGGGTRIGHCLQRFNQIHGKRLLSSKSVVMIFSDGWDRGEAELLEGQMAFFKRKVYKIIWLNPLAGTKDYQPSCQGMSAALPYVDYFLPLGNLQDLRLLGRTLEKVIM